MSDIEKRGSLSLLIGLLTSIGIIIILLLVIVYRKNKQIKKSLKEKVKEAMREKRKRQYLVHSNSLNRQASTSSIKLKFMKSHTCGIHIKFIL